MSDVLANLLKTIGDVAGAAELAQYVQQLETEVSRLRDLNDKFIKIIDTLKNEGK